MIWWIILWVFVVLLLGLLFAPLKLGLNSIQNNYYVSYAWVLKVSAHLLPDDIKIRFHLFGLERGTSVMELLAGRKRKKSIPERVADQVVKTTKRRVPYKMILNFLKSFRVKRFYINADLGSVYYNAWLFPIGEIFRRDNVYCTTNFEGKVDVEILIVNRPARMLWAIVKTQLKQKLS